MKPVLLKMESFGSYRDETIDFTNKDHGIFLITGDTGAGKTTIFDAIMYALYDTSSGGKRNDSMMISQYALPGERTRVTFVFRIGKEQYRVVRSPEQNKYKKKVSEDGSVEMELLKTKELASVSLTLPDGTEYPGKKKDIDERIREIIGIDGNQFTQIAMLAQGDFLKLLHADSKERRQIFADIFDTRMYELFESELKQMFMDLYGSLQDNQKDIERRLEDICCKQAEELEEVWQEQGHFSEDRKEEIFALLEQIQASYKRSEKQIQETIAEAEKEKEALSKQLDQAESLQNDFDKLKEAEELQEELLGAKEEQEKRKEQLESAERALHVTPDYERKKLQQKLLREKREAVEQAEKLLEIAGKEMEELQQQKELACAAYEEKYQGLVSNISGLQQSLENYDLLEHLQKELTNTQKELKELEERQKEAEKLQEQIASLKTSCEEAEEALLLAKQEHDKLFHLFLTYQADILRKELVEGQPCPVCGSVHHSKVESSLQQNVSKEAVEAAKGLVDEKDTLVKKLQQEMTEKEQKRQDILHALNSQRAALMTTEKMQAQQLLQLRRKLPYGTIIEVQQVIRSMEEESKRLQSAKDTGEEAFRKKQQQVSVLQGQREALEKEVVGCLEALKQADEQLETTLTKQKFSDEQAYLSAFMEQSDLQECKEKVDSFQKKWIRNQYDLNNYRERTRGKEPVDINGLKEQYQQLDEILGQKRKALQAIVSEQAQNHGAYQKLKQYYSKREKIAQQYKLVKELYETAGGKLSKKHLNFQTYIQRRYFKKVIQAANERLVVMSNKQFLLQCRDLENLGTQKEVGLDLDIYSIPNDQVRDVKTLSGGESFMAALAMALGLSDLIQNTAGRVCIETMFIDEGFGSLSDETRNQALHLLVSLSEGNRLIGIISHVSELKSQVETKLVITKSEKGSKATWEM